MPDLLLHLRSRLRRRTGSGGRTVEIGAACSWDRMRAVYEEQAARGVPEAVEGLEMIEQDRWPTNGQRRER